MKRFEITVRVVTVDDESEASLRSLVKDILAAAILGDWLQVREVEAREIEPAAPKRRRA